MGLDDANLVPLEQYLLEPPQRGDVIEGADGALFAYPMNVQENLTADQKKAITKMIELIKKE